MIKFEQKNNSEFTVIAEELHQWIKKLTVFSNIKMSETATLQQQQIKQQQFRLCI